MVLDAKRAFLHADALTETYVKPPHLRDRERCWSLEKCMYGTLPAAAAVWQHLVQKVGADIGLLSSSNCPCAFGHSTRNLGMVTISSSLEMVMTSIGCYRNWMRSSSWCRKARLGLGHDSEASVLNRCVTYTDSGLTWEADPRDAELAVAELGLQAARPHTSSGGAKPSASPR